MSNPDGNLAFKTAVEASDTAAVRACLAEDVRVHARLRDIPFTGASPTFPRPRVRRTIGAFGIALSLITLATGCGDDSPGADRSAVEDSVSPRIEITAHEMALEPDAIAVEAGDVEVVLHNDGTMLHDLRIEDQPFIIEAPAGETATSHVTLEPGRYQLFCSLPGHRDAGMQG
jgi:uncharacterized cupredoxin-like copper-binding protein